MRKILLAVLFILILIYVAVDRYALKTGTDESGKYHIVMVDKKTGEITNIWGK